MVQFEICYFSACQTLKAVVYSIRLTAHEHYNLYSYITNIYLVHYVLTLKEEPLERKNIIFHRISNYESDRRKESVFMKQYGGKCFPMDTAASIFLTKGRFFVIAQHA